MRGLSSVGCFGSVGLGLGAEGGVGHEELQKLEKQAPCGRMSMWLLAGGRQPLHRPAQPLRQPMRLLRPVRRA